MSEDQPVDASAGVSRDSPIVVLGMHRSGTSLATHLLRTCGWFLGDDEELLPPRYDNLEGFFERADVQVINEQALEDLGSAWWDPPVAEELPDNPDLERRLADLVTDVRARAGGYRFAIKDPRISVLWPYWRSVLPEARVLLAVRHPLESAASLTTRDVLPTEVGLALWHSYTAASVAAAVGRDTFVLDYRDLLEDPPSTLAGLAAWLGLEEVPLAAQQLVKPQLRHEFAADADSLLSERQADLWSWLRSLAGRPVTLRPTRRSLQDDLGLSRLAQYRLEQDGPPAMPMLARAVNARVRLAQNLRLLEEVDAVGLRHVVEATHSRDRADVAQQQAADQEARSVELMAALELAQAEARDLARRLEAAEDEAAALQSELSTSGLTLGRAQLDLEASNKRLSAALRDAAESRDHSQSTERALADTAAALSRTTALLELSQASELSLRDSVRSLTEEGSWHELEAHVLQSQLSRATATLADQYQRLVIEPAHQGEGPDGNDTRSSGELSHDYALIAASGAVDQAWYHQTYPDVAAARQDAVEHYLLHGWREARDPGPWFSTGYYLSENPDVEAAGTPPLVHYLTDGWREGRLPRPHVLPHTELDPLGRLCPLIVETAGLARTGRSTARTAMTALPPLEKEHPAVEPPGAEAARVVTFYLPQYHPIPENDEWWGEGFTEWRNVRRGEPLFEGHYQPHEPGELGYYDLRQPEVLERQVELAKLHGVAAFCFYAYWFAGKRLLESPLEDFLSRQDLDLGFCVCWANENWTRTWDGQEQDVLIAQHHSAEDDLKFIEEMSRYMRDPRYFRVCGRPVLLVYRPSLLPDPAATAERWRQWCRESGLGEIMLAYVQGFESVDPRTYGFDYAVEFPPNNTDPQHVKVPGLTDYEGHIYDWQELAARSKDYRPPTYPTWRGLCPSWDNEARRPGRGAVLVGSTPEGFRDWLVAAAQDTRQRLLVDDERVLFVNAWNEWAEGTHLEPDKKHGYQWLHAVRDMQEAVSEIGDGTGPGVLVVTHDMYKHGAQMLALHWVRELKRLGRRVEVVALEDGPLRVEFEALCPVTCLDGADSGAAATRAAVAMHRRGFTTAICNTAVSGAFAEALRAAGTYCVGFVHEMSSVLRQPRVHSRASRLAVSAHEVYFPAQVVADQFPFTPRGEVRVQPQGIYLTPHAARRAPGDGGVRVDLGIPATAFVVLGVAYGDLRKGLDLFAEAATLVNRDRPDVHFVWLGTPDTHDPRIVESLRVNASPTLHVCDFFADPRPYYEAADLLALPSREDPFPSVTLEAMAHGLTCVAFASATGQETLITSEGGTLVSPTTALSLAEGITGQLAGADRPSRESERAARALRLAARFNFRRYVMDVLSSTPAALPRVSVVLPNFQYADLLKGRVEQILRQTLPVYELIVLDDASTDDSVRVLQDALAQASCAVSLVVNETNSGSVFAQWRKGAAMAAGDVIWIAEADDMARDNLCEVLAAEFRDDTVALAYCQSRQIGPEGEVLAPDYLDYVSDITSRDWERRYKKDGLSEIQECLSIKNPIPNVSSVLFRASALKRVLTAFTTQEQAALPTAGDWWVYLHVLTQGACVYNPVAMNDHRRHPQSVIASNLGERHLQEIISVQKVARSLVNTDATQDSAAEDWVKAVAAHMGLSAGRPS